MEAAAGHRLGAEPVGLAQDHRAQRHPQGGAGDEQPRAVADEPGRLGLGADHHPGGVDQRDHRQPEGVAELQVAGGLVGAVGGDRAGEAHRVVGDHAHRPALDPRQRGQHLGREALAQHGHRAGVGEALDRGAHVVGAPAALGHDVAQQRLVGLLPVGQRALEVGDQPLGGGDGLGLVGDLDVDDAVRALDRERPDRVGLEAAEPAALDHRRAAHPERDVSVATIRSEAPASTALPAKQRPATTAIRGTTPESRAQSANARVSSAETTA